MMQMEPRTFIKVGIVCFTISVLCAVANFFIYFENMNFFSRTSSLASIVFQACLVASFVYVLKMTPPEIQTSEQSISADEIGDIIKEVQGGEHIRPEKEIKKSKAGHRKSAQK